MATLNQLRAGGAAQGEGPSVFEQLLQRRFDPDAYHVMQQRDDQLIRDELLHGEAAKVFVYSFPLQGSTVTGVSVIGARQLASEYGGIKTRIVATVEKRRALFIFRSFEPLNIETQVLRELEDEVDYYECIMQVDDIKTGNSLQVRKKESKFEQKSAAKGGGFFERPHYDVICESKAYRNAVLSVLPQSVIQSFKLKHLAAGNSSNERTMDDLRSGATQFSAKHGISLARDVLAGLTHADLMGLGNAAALGVDAFVKAAQALELVEAATGEVKPPAPAAPTSTAKTPAPPPPAAAAKPAQTKPADDRGEDRIPTDAELEELDRQRSGGAPPAQAQPETTTRRRSRNMPDVP